MTISRSFTASSMPDRYWWNALWPDAKGPLLAMGITPAMSVIDLCCGDGFFTAPLASLVRPRLIAIDLDGAMLEKARAEVARADVQEPLWIQGDAMEIGTLVSDPVDYVLMANTFHGVAEKEELARRVAGILVPGGRFGIINWLPLPREETRVLEEPRGPKTALRMAPDRVTAAVTPCGLALETLVAIPPYHYGAVYLKQ